jgi:hypothetical protein
MSNEVTPFMGDNPSFLRIAEFEYFWKLFSVPWFSSAGGRKSNMAIDYAGFEKQSQNMSYSVHILDTERNSSCTRKSRSDGPHKHLTM